MPRIAPQNQIGTFFGLIVMATVIGITFGRSGMGILTNRAGLINALLILALLMFVMAMIILSLPKEHVKTSRQGPKTIRVAYTNALALLKNPNIIFLFTTGFFLFFGYLGMVTFLTFYLLQPPFSYDSAAIGSVSLLGLSAVFGAPFSGRLIAKTGPRPVALGGLAVVACAIINLGLASKLGLLASGLFLIFFGVFACQPAVLVLINERVENDRKGSASSIYLFICLAAGSLSSMLLGTVWSGYGWAGVTIFSLISIALGALSLSIDNYLTMKVGMNKRNSSSISN
jgi:YNFM family putative membrane transporter